MLGEVGMSKINNSILGTAREAKIPYPNEVGLMAKYAGIVKNIIGKARKTFTKVRIKIKTVEKKIKGLVRGSHLFAKTKEQKRKIGKKLYHVSQEIH